jgi:hypothetical protein
VAVFVAALVAVSFVEKDTGHSLGRLRSGPGPGTEPAGGSGAEAVTGSEPG